MSLERLLPLLRCPECRGELRREEAYLTCPRCRETFPLREGIPVLVKKDDEDARWEEYFHRLSARAGDSEAANRYFSRKNFRFVRQNLLSLLGPAKGLAILDVGCGTGHFSQGLTGDNLVVGVDISFAMLGFARKKKLEVVHASGKRLPFEAGVFDLVIANNIIQSIREGAAFVAELARVTRPRGRILVCAPNGENLGLPLLRFLEKRKHRKLERHSVEDLTRFCFQAGLKGERIIFLFYPFGLVKSVVGEVRPRFLERHLSTSLAVLARKPGKGPADD